MQREFDEKEWDAIDGTINDLVAGKEFGLADQAIEFYMDKFNSRRDMLNRLPPEYGVKDRLDNYCRAIDPQNTANRRCLKYVTKLQGGGPLSECVPAAARKLLSPPMQPQPPCSSPKAQPLLRQVH